MYKHLTETHRESLIAVLGAPPDLCPLEPEILTSEEVDGYIRRKVRYQVHPAEFVCVYVLIPKDQPLPAPAVICHHRHNGTWSVGKSEVVGLAGDPDEAIGVELVKRGYVVLAPDALAYEERRPSADAGYENNFQELAVRLLKGETLLKKVTWDISRAIDYLEEMPEVNPEAIGFMGHGYGSRMAVWVAALDPRVAAAVGHGHWASMHEMIARMHPLQIEFSVPRLLQVMDYDRIVGLIAPRPFLMSTVENDPNSLDCEAIYAKAVQIYARFEAADRLTLFRYPPRSDGRFFPPEAREAAYAWLDGWLKPR